MNLRCGVLPARIVVRGRLGAHTAKTVGLGPIRLHAQRSER
jgi:hypothetical protein